MKTKSLIISTILLFVGLTHADSPRVVAERCGTFQLYNEKTHKVDITETRKIRLLENETSFDVEIYKLNDNNQWDKIDYAFNCPMGKRYSLCEYKTFFEIELKPKRWTPQSIEDITSIELYVRDEYERANLFRFNEECSK